MNTLTTRIVICAFSAISCLANASQGEPFASSVIIEHEKPTLKQIAEKNKLVSTIRIKNNSESPISVEADTYNLNCILSPCLVVPPAKQDTIDVSLNDDANRTDHLSGKVVLRINKINSNMDPAKPRQIEHFLKEKFPNE